jgi:proteasome lid subunit RPN8/RPN11
MIRLTPALAARIAAEGEQTYPNECCGVLLGHLTDPGPDGGPLREVVDLWPIDNAREAAERYHRFVIEPLDYLHAEQAAAAQGLDLLGFYHSHPDHPARPSEYDREHAWPNLSYLVLAVAGRAEPLPRAGSLTSWELTYDRTEFRPEPILD